eukprot:755570-Hanusia_phi.AAC.2
MATTLDFKALFILALLPAYLFAHVSVDRSCAPPLRTWQESRQYPLSSMQTLGVVLDHMRACHGQRNKTSQVLGLRGGSSGEPGGAIHTNTIYLSGLPKYVNEEWVAVFVGKKSIKRDSKTGKLQAFGSIYACQIYLRTCDQVFIYRDKQGVPTGACVVGIEGISEAQRICKELDGKSIEGVERMLCIRAKVRDANRKETATGVGNCRSAEVSRYLMFWSGGRDSQTRRAGGGWLFKFPALL